MPVSEFDWINQYFREPFAWSNSADLGSALGIGDDAAIVSSGNDQSWVVATDTLNQGIHFTADMSAEVLAYKALAVNLSDLAAMGASPSYFFCALSLPDWPKARLEVWLADFSKSLLKTANTYDIRLMGGDTCKSVSGLSVTMTVMGCLPVQQVGLRRSSAQVGDRIYVSGELGWAGLGLQVQRGQLLLAEQDAKKALQALYYPKPQVALGQTLLGTAHAAIDLSDGLQGDLTHICEESKVSAVIDLDALPLPALTTSSAALLSKKALLGYGLTAGEDYQLCFTIAEDKIGWLEEIPNEFAVTCIGQIEDCTEPCIRYCGSDSVLMSKHEHGKFSSFQHF